MYCVNTFFEGREERENIKIESIDTEKRNKLIKKALSLYYGKNVEIELKKQK